MIPYREEPEYPRVGLPLENLTLGKKKKLKITFRGHIILSRTEGKFVEPDFETEKEALEKSAELVVNMRKNGTS